MNTTSRISEAEINLYHGGRTAYLARVSAELSALESRLAAGPTDADDIGGGELGIGMATVAEWEDMIRGRIANVRAALEANA